MPSTMERPGNGLRLGVVSSTTSLTVLLLVGACVAYVVYSYLKASTRPYSKLPLPPGPPRLPLLGNLFNNPFHFRWLSHLQWRYTYGPLVYMKVLGRSVIILTTNEAAHELLNKRAPTYSGRPYSVIGGELLAKGYSMIFRQYDARFRLQQRLHAHGLNAQAVGLYQPITELETLQFLHDIIQDTKASPEEAVTLPDGDTRPIKPHRHFLRWFASNVSVIMYGYRLFKDDPESEVQLNFFHECPTSRIIETPTLVDIFPSLKHVPYFFSPWKRRVKPLFKREAAHHIGNFRKALSQPGFNISKLVANRAQHLDPNMTEAEAAWAPATLLLAAGETSPAILCWFVLAMVEYPRVMHKAQAMLDEVVGHERLPTYADRAQLPFIDAVMDEVFRWRPIVPAGIDHVATEEDEYMGYRIPKDSMITISMWALHRDQAVFGPDCDNFRPERWLEKERLPSHTFGFGRRTCPGRHVGRDGLWIMMARVLWAFDLEAPIDPSTGKKKFVDNMDMQPVGIAIPPTPFDVLFRRRGKWVEEVVERDFAAADFDMSKIMEQIGLGSSKLAV
ncbi:cytochrome p450 [Colletotrichum sojae]|uniref:Cytochrome p450 n=1 Tax=Colletotrichum sojae TaxID=2175907 RepID=A0A8H6IST8_9PEZI|nr:cytochrome p450 [Colletotrichum sojae]